MSEKAEQVEERVIQVTQLQMQRFAQAVGDLNPIYFDEAAAREAGYKGIVAPPTFLTSLLNLQAGPPEADLRQDGLDPAIFPGPIRPDAALMGGGQEIELQRPIYAGDTITLRRRLISSHERDSSMGRLTFVVAETRYTNQAGETVAVVRDTTIARQD